MAKAPQMEFAPFRIESWARTHQGLVRKHNEDSYCAKEAQGLWAVADGMGGHEGGDFASATLVEKLDEVELSKDFDAAREQVTEAIRNANRAILVEAKKRKKQMGSTIVALLVQGERYSILWVGDSRAYLLRDGDFSQVTRDHTQVQEMVDRGILSPQDAIGHPMGHILSRAVGVRDEVDVDQVTGEVLPGDVLLLCSDGLHGYVDEKEVARLLARGSPERASEELVDLTLANGAPDNVTVVAIWASDPTLLSLPDR